MRKGAYCLLLILCLGCSQKERVITPAFYHWQTKLELSHKEQNYLDQLKVRKLYVKFFDVDWDAARKKAVPLANLIAEKPQNDSLDIVPVVFITNRTFTHLSEKEIEELSRHIHKKINKLWDSFSTQQIREVQFDCDWSKTTKKKYFSFLEHFRKVNKSKDCILSATIRLHQIKFPDQTGIPPVDRGMLMFYNMADVENYDTSNSILDIAVAKQYLHPKTKYPLPLDMALPVFRWGVLFRNGELIKLINNLDVSAMKDISRFKAISPNQYEVVKSTYLKGYYLYAADVLRLESVSIEELIEAASLLSDYSYNNKATVSLYHLDTTTIKHYTYEELQNVFQVFTN